MAPPAVDAPLQAPMTLQYALQAAQHLADTSGTEVTIRLQSSSPNEAADDGSTPDVDAGDFVVRPTNAPDASQPVPQAPASTVSGLGRWTVTITVALGTELADTDSTNTDSTAIDRAVSALFSDGPPADLHALITRPDGTHRHVALRPLRATRPTT